MDKSDKPRAELFSEYLSDSKILIVDPSSASRVRLANTLIKMGAKANLITMIGQFESAKDHLKKDVPKIIVSEYYLGSNSGFDLMIDFKSINAKDKKSLSILITANSSQSAVARAAEEDVDSFIIKPYTLESLERALLNAAIQKISPSEYVMRIEEGKELMLQGKLVEAKEMFHMATKLDSKPALAFFYHGQVEQMEKLLGNASKDYHMGLRYNEIHFKCLVSLFDILMDQKKFVEAYDIVKKIADYFPANPKRLGSVIHLAVITKNYEDMEKYYQIFTSLDERNDELIKYICSGLIVTARWCLENSKTGQALSLFDKASVSSATQTQYLQFIVETLTDAGMNEEAEKYLKRFRADDFEKSPYMISKYLLKSRQSDSYLAVQLGRELIASQIHHSGCYKVLLRNLLILNKLEEFQELKKEFIMRWPNEADEIIQLEQCLDKPASKAA